MLLDILPEDFVRLSEASMGDGLWQALRRGLASPPTVSVRLNPFKCRADGGSLAGCSGEVAWCDGGFYLDTRPNFTFDPLFHAGLYYVQEASSMFLDRVLRQYAGERPVIALDLCAAPGGKSTVTRAALPGGSLIVSNEPVRSRVQVLAENIMKFGHEDFVVTNNYPRDFGRAYVTFDVLIADVPCSGEGMFRKDEAAVGEWSLQNVEKCWRLQRDIVADAWPCLRKGGLLVYSTCTFNTKENERNVKYICEELGAETLAVDVSGEWHITGSLLPGFDAPVYRFLPGLSRGEGLFMAVMRKTGGETGPCVASKAGKAVRQRRQGCGIETGEELLKWISQPGGFSVVRSGDTFTAVPKAWRGVYDTLAKRLNVVCAGVRLGEAKGKSVVPSQPLALSRVFDRSAFPCVGLGYGEALGYLRKEAVALPAGTPHGFVVVSYRGVPLGFAKNVGTRANNLYPAGWKIKSTHTPDGCNEILKGFAAPSLQG